MKEYKLTVIILTYGHQEFILQAINSVLTQIIDFNAELIIINDCSPDRTEELIGAYDNSTVNGFDIKIINNYKNLGATKSWANGLRLASGLYISTLEGDDYWFDINKINKQIKFLELNNDYVGVSHKTLTVSKTGHRIKDLYNWNDVVGRLCIDEYLNNRTYSNTACLYKNIFNNEDIKNLEEVHPMIGEHTMAIILLDKGDIYTLNCFMSAYRYVINENNYNYNSLRTKFQQFQDRLLVFENLRVQFPKYNYDEKILYILKVYFFHSIKEQWLLDYLKKIRVLNLVSLIKLCYLISGNSLKFLKKRILLD